MNRAAPPGRGRSGGYVLIEVLISVLIFSLGMLGLVAIQARALQVQQESKVRADAVFAANDLMGRMWVDRANLASYAGTTALSGLPSGKAVVTVSGNVVTLTITWRPPGTPADRRYVTAATLVAN